VYYWIAFLKTYLKEADAPTYLEKANALSTHLVFPFRQSSAKVLGWAIHQSESWKPKYYLGLIYWNMNNLATAKALFTQCGNPDFAAFYAARAALFSDQNYSADIRRAAELDPREWRYGKLLVNRLVEEKKYEEALVAAKDYKKKFPNDFRISMLLAKTLLLNRQYKACSDLLEKVTILPYEGATDGRQLYREAWLMQAIDQINRGKFRDASSSIGKSRQWPERLGVGKPYDSDIDDRPEKYLEGLMIEKSKGNAYADATWKSIVAFKSGDGPNTLITALALRKLGRQQEAETLLNEWVNKQPDNKVARWCRDAFAGVVAPIPSELLNNDNLRLVKEIVTIP
jgi:tetratricopeptide (TPR) repeat protein